MIVLLTVKPWPGSGVPDDRYILRDMLDGIYDLIISAFFSSEMCFLFLFQLCRLLRDDAPCVQYQFTSFCPLWLPPFLSILITPSISSLKVSRGHFSSCLSIPPGMTTTAPLYISPLLLINLLPLICWESTGCKTADPFRQPESFRERKLDLALERRWSKLREKRVNERVRIFPLSRALARRKSVHNLCV